MSLKLALSRALCVCVCLSVHSVDLQDFFPFQFTRSPSLQIFPTKKLFTRNFKQKKNYSGIEIAAHKEPSGV